MASKNSWGKTRPITKPYATVTQDGWTWRVLKAYKARKSELNDPYARWLCAVSSPFTGAHYDVGDCYITSIPRTIELVVALSERTVAEAQL
jgi:hypothetical protein